MYGTCCSRFRSHVLISLSCTLISQFKFGRPVALDETIRHDALTPVKLLPVGVVVFAIRVGAHTQSAVIYRITA
jgi:hypothetical protein